MTVIENARWVFWILTALAAGWGAVSDYKTMTVKNRIPLMILIFGFFTGGSFPLKLMALIVPPLLAIIAGKVLGHESGGADLKMYGALGFNLGPYGLLACLFLTFLLSLAHAKLQKRSTKDIVPMCTYLGIATAICTVFRLVIMLKEMFL